MALRSSGGRLSSGETRPEGMDSIVELAVVEDLAEVWNPVVGEDKTAVGAINGWVAMGVGRRTKSAEAKGFWKETAKGEKALPGRSRCCRRYDLGTLPWTDGRP